MLKALMNKLLLTLIFIVLVGINNQLHAFPVNDVEFAQDKIQIQSATNQCGDLPLVSLDSLFGKLHGDLPFLFSRQICLYSLSAKKTVNVSELDTHENAAFMADRYRTTLNNIGNSVHRLNYAKRFLKRASKEYFITESFLSADTSVTSFSPNANLVAITVWGKTTKGKLSGVIIRLLDKRDMKNNEVAHINVEQQEASQLTVSEIKSLVNYVIDGET